LIESILAFRNMDLRPLCDSVHSAARQGMLPLGAG
jgi:hypothetical protein